MPLTEISFWRLAEAEPERVAVVAGGAAVSAGQLLADSNRLVHGLRARGLRAGDVLAVALYDGLPFLELYFAAMQAGWHFAPLNPRLAAPEITYVLGDSRPSAFVFERRTESASRAVAEAGFPGQCFTADTVPGFTHMAALKEGQPATAPPDRRAGEKMFYTSGTTGRPRAVRRPLGDASPDVMGAAAADHLVRMAGIAPQGGCIHLVASPLYHSGSLLWCTDHLQVGHTVVLTDRWTAQGTLEAIERHRVTGAFLVPTHFHRLLALPEAVKRQYDLSSLRHVVHAGAPCPIEVKRRMLAWWGPVIYEVYGSAEGGGVGIGPDEWLAKPGSVGKPGGGVHILAEDGADCAPGDVGAVYFKLVRPFAYHNDPQKTAAARRGDYFTVGDLGYLDEDGYLFLCGRSSDVIISGGVKIHPAEVEGALIGHPGVGDVAVFGIPDEEWGEQVKAVIQLAPDITPGPELTRELLEHCRQRLASMKCPRSIDFVAELPRDPNGKLYKRLLRDRYWQS